MVSTIFTSNECTTPPKTIISKSDLTCLVLAITLNRSSSSFRFSTPTLNFYNVFHLFFQGVLDADDVGSYVNEFKFSQKPINEIDSHWQIYKYIIKCYMYWLVLFFKKLNINFDLLNIIIRITSFMLYVLIMFHILINFLFII